MPWPMPGIAVVGLAGIVRADVDTFRTASSSPMPGGAGNPPDQPKTVTRSGLSTQGISQGSVILFGLATGSNVTCRKTAIAKATRYDEGPRLMRQPGLKRIARSSAANGCCCGHPSEFRSGRGDGQNGRRGADLNLGGRLPALHLRSGSMSLRALQMTTFLIWQALIILLVSSMTTWLTNP